MNAHTAAQETEKAAKITGCKKGCKYAQVIKKAHKRNLSPVRNFSSLLNAARTFFLPLHIINLQSAGRCDMVHVL